MKYPVSSATLASKAGKPWVLGMASSHNGGICLLHGEDIVVAVQEERLTRQKRANHPGAVASLSIRYCLDYAGISAKELDMVVLCPAFSGRTEDENLHFNSLLSVDRNKIHTRVIPHHLGHAIGAFSNSGFSDAAVLVVDGRGSSWNELPADEQHAATEEQYRLLAKGNADVREIVSIYLASNQTLLPVHKFLSAYDKRGTTPGPEVPFFASVGDMYSSVGQQIFGSLSEGPGKVMGLAPYGTVRYPTDAFIEYSDDGIKFYNRIQSQLSNNRPWPECPELWRDLAASVQNALEDTLIKIVNLISRKCQSANLCYAGGVALNSVANERIVREKLFKDVFIMPAAEDSGTAIGAAYYGLWQFGAAAKSNRVQVDSYGRSYTSKNIEETGKSFPGLSIEKPDCVADVGAKLIAEGKIIGWFQGGSELGPRALGCRSILCDPRIGSMKDTLNARVKFRESFRPFAPMILSEYLNDWFVTETDFEDSPFMLRVMSFREDRKHLVPAVVHVDGTGRVQTIHPSSTLRVRELLQKFHKLTALPIILNTSFNIGGDPIVETPNDAMRTFLFSGIDACVIGDYLVTKKPEIDPFSFVPRSRVMHTILTKEERQMNPSLNGMQKLDSHHILSFSMGLLSQYGIPPSYKGYVGAITPSPLGDVIHAIPAQLGKLLDLVDGTSTLLEIFETVCEEWPEATSRDVFYRDISLLFRRHIIELS